MEKRVGKGNEMKIRVITEEEVAATKEWAKKVPAEMPHNCMENAVPYTSDGALGHGWECGVCGAFLQAG